MSWGDQELVYFPHIATLRLCLRLWNNLHVHNNIAEFSCEMQSQSWDRTMPNRPRLLVVFADCAARRIRSPTPWPTSKARQKLPYCRRGNYPENIFILQYCVSDVNWTSRINMSQLFSVAHRPYSVVTASHSFREQLELFQWSWYLRAERAQQAVHFQLFHYPLRPRLSTETLRASLMGIDNSGRTVSHQTKPPLNKLSSQAMKSEAVKKKWEPPSASQFYSVGHKEAEM